MTDIALVTGAGGAIGAEVARTLFSRGCKLVLVDAERGKARLPGLAATLGGASVIAGDIAAEETWSTGLPRVAQELGGPPTRSALFAGAGLPRVARERGGPPPPAALVAGAWRGGKPLHEEENDDVWRAMMSANLDTVHRSLRAILPAMVARRRGSIVVVGARAAEQPWTSAKAAAYAASKAAVGALARAVAAEGIDYGVGHHAG